MIQRYRGSTPMRAKVGDVIRITHPDGVTEKCKEFMRLHGNALVVMEIRSPMEYRLANYLLQSLSGETMTWDESELNNIPLYDEEYELEPFLTAVRARRHA